MNAIFNEIVITLITKQELATVYLKSEHYFYAANFVGAVSKEVREMLNRNFNIDDACSSAIMFVDVNHSTGMLLSAVDV